MKFMLYLLMAVAVHTTAQDVLVETENDRDLSGYKTFRFGDSEIVTPKERKKVSDAKLKKLIEEAVERELVLKGLQKGGNDAQLVVTYMVGSFRHTNVQNLGPLGLAPGQTSANWTRDSYEGDMVIDVNDNKDGALIWRIHSATSGNSPGAESTIEQIVAKGFRKWGQKPKHKKH
ncbi:MAG: DUF4136 domain-containing protein [Bacteroidota bacterium]